MNDTVIKVENLSKQYNLGELHHQTNSFRDKVTSFFKKDGSPKKVEILWALKDVSFEVKRGEILGIIGLNGAGKSTLLKILSRITKPTSGKALINGRVGNLLEVGTGFHPELTGRENIYLNSAILGMKKAKISNKFDEIVAFAEIEKFLDTPVKRYSSGMYVRLAFSVAAHLEPDILLIDEVLAVGDINFQKKCLGKMENVSADGRTVLFVSHNMAVIENLCNRVIILDRGRFDFSGKTSEGVERYINKSMSRAETALVDRKNRRGKGEIKFSNILLEKNDGTLIKSVQSGMNLNIKLIFSSDQDLKNVVLRIQFVSQEGHLMFVCSNFHSSQPFYKFPKKAVAVCNIPKFPLPPGSYYIHLQCLRNLEVMDDIEYAEKIEVERGDFYGTGRLPALKGGIFVSHNWKLLM